MVKRKEMQQCVSFASLHPKYSQELWNWSKIEEVDDDSDYKDEDNADDKNDEDTNYDDEMDNLGKVCKTWVAVLDY